FLNNGLNESSLNYLKNKYLKKCTTNIKAILSACMERITVFQLEEIQKSADESNEDMEKNIKAKIQLIDCYIDRIRSADCPKLIFEELKEFFSKSPESSSLESAKGQKFKNELDNFKAEANNLVNQCKIVIKSLRYDKMFKHKIIV
ncbi:MAG: hypothetical protein MHPSP_004560, partial [Paramarteilia canceri]